MKFCHSITVRVFAKPEEDNDQILSRLSSLFPFSLTAEKIPIKTTSATGADERRIILIHEVTLDKDRHINDFLSFLRIKLNDEQRGLLLTRFGRLDLHLNYILRLDKQKLFEGIYFLTDTGNCYHIKLCLAAYPKNNEACIKLLKIIFGQN
jgi:RNA binding exosome subunit